MTVILEQFQQSLLDSGLMTEQELNTFLGAIPPRGWFSKSSRGEHRSRGRSRGSSTLLAGKARWIA